MKLLVLAVSLALSGLSCATVRPYERGELQQRAMRAKPALDEDFAAHVAEVRESAIGASSGENASCGCR